MSNFDEILGLIHNNHVKSVGKDNMAKPQSVESQVMQQVAAPMVSSHRTIDERKSRSTEVQNKLKMLQSKMEKSGMIQTTKEPPKQVSVANTAIQSQTSKTRDEPVVVEQRAPLQQQEPKPARIDDFLPQPEQPKPTNPHAECRRREDQLTAQLAARDAEIQRLQGLLLQRQNASQMLSSFVSDAPAVDVQRSPKVVYKQVAAEPVVVVAPAVQKTSSKPVLLQPKNVQDNLYRSLTESTRAKEEPIAAVKHQDIPLAPGKKTSDFDKLWEDLEEDDVSTVKQLFDGRCLKVLVPEPTQLKESAAKRLVQVWQEPTGTIIRWLRESGGKLEPSGSVQLGDVVNVIAGEDARAVRSRILAARKAGYVQDVFGLIQDGVLDSIQPKTLISSCHSAVLFTADQVIIFDFEAQKEPFAQLMKILAKAGL